MKCERCGRNEATFYFKSNINGQIAEQHLCADCAREMGYTEKLRPRNLFEDDFFTRPFRLFEPLFEPLGARLLTEFPEPLCEDEQPRVEVRPKQLLANEEQEKWKSEREYNALQAQLKTAIEEENFEEAARLRDAIRGLNQ
ncbi:MAG: UvrB/UvrC motif-containing protein [Eubacteriales bacterium]|nr:UvrB/UvrC motif-containing protein [Eubacteriales bacterium]